jgi:chorismate dehydratase
MVNLGLTQTASRSLPRVCAVSYLNSVPLVWGAEHGPQRGRFDLFYAVPSRCADLVAAGQADIGLVPVIEIARHGLASVPGIGIASRGEVRSILLISKVPFDQVRRLATDTGSRTSVQLARVVLARKFGAEPEVFPADPPLVPMLDQAEAALLIGDAALSVDIATLEYPCLDLGREWFSLTGLPFVFAEWAGRESGVTDELVEMLHGSCQFGLSQIDRIIEVEAARRGFPKEFVRDYFTRNVVFPLGPEEETGLRLFLDYARDLGNPVLTEARMR